MVDESGLRAAAKAASARFVEEYALVAMPKTMLPKIVVLVNQGGIDFDLVDDGEDDGIPAFVTVLRSSVMVKPNRAQLITYRWSMAMFMLWALSMGVFTIAGKLEMAGGAAVLMVLFAANTLAAHKRWDRSRRLYEMLHGRGF